MWCLRMDTVLTMAAPVQDTELPMTSVADDVADDAPFQPFRLFGLPQELRDMVHEWTE